MKKNWLNEKTIIITGASSGLGKGLAEKFIFECGAKVIGIGRSEKKMKDFCESLGELKNNFSYFLFDVSKRENWLIFKEKLISENIKPSLLINNAGVLPPFKQFQDYTETDIAETMNINFFSASYSISALFDMLVSESGGIVNVASSAALMTVAGTSIYSASKCALKALTESIALETKSIYVGCVMPGFTKTDIFRAQNTDIKDSKMISAICSPCDRIVRKIFNGIKKKKRRMVFGADAHIMSGLNRIAPCNAGRLCSAVIKSAHIKLFNDVFGDNNL